MTSVLDEIEIFRQERKNVKKIVLCDKRVVIDGEVDEPVPMRVEAEKDGGSVEGGCECRGATDVGEVRAPDDVNIGQGEDSAGDA